MTTSSSFPVIESDRMKELSKTPNVLVVHDMIKSMGPYKAPGVDGFPPIFYQRNWEVVCSDLLKFVSGAFEGSIDISEANWTLISLIPKRDQPQRVEHFRPISLCTVQYKCVTKIVARRLRSILGELVSPF